MPDLIRKTNALSRVTAPEHRYTTLSLQKGFAARAHVDADNLGPSVA